MTVSGPTKSYKMVWVKNLLQNVNNSILQKIKFFSCINYLVLNPTEGGSSAPPAKH